MLKNSILLFCVPSLVLAEAITELETITVTGSSIEEDTHKLLPIAVMTEKDIKKTGVRTINDLLRYMPEVDFADNGNQQSLAGEAGSSFIQLRGLNARNTLVLLDGKRMPLNPTQVEDGSGAGIDINLIPLSAIERVEVLKSGSSAVYGSDAVAGVVNFITKSNIKNATVFGNYGNSARNDGEEKNVGFIAGFGDLNKDKHNTFLSFEYFKRDPIYRADRSLTKTTDFRRFGGRDLRSSSAPQGNIIDENGDVTGSLRSCPPENLNGNTCRFNTNSKPSTELIATERYNVLLKNALSFNSTTHLNSSFLYSVTETPNAVQPGPGQLNSPDGGQPIRTRFMQGGNRTSDRIAEFFQFKTALDGLAFGQFWELAAGYAENNNDRFHGNYYLRDTLNRLIDNGQLDPTATNNNQQLINSINQRFNVREDTTLAHVDFKLEGDVVQTNEVNLQYAAGVQWRNESLAVKPDAVLLKDQLYAGFTITPFDQSRNVLSGFSEVKLKLFSQLEAQAAVRYDGYSNAENISPSFAIAYTPDPRLSFHGNWGQSFLMPSLKQVFAQGETATNAASGADDCRLIGLGAGCVATVYEVAVANPDLKPERATSWGAGFTFKPTDYLSGSFDYWQIDKSAEVYRPGFRTILQNGGKFVLKNGDFYVNTPNSNLAVSSYQGIDAGISLHSNIGNWGHLSLNNNLTYYLDINRRRSGEETETVLGYYGATVPPPWRLLSSLTWDFNHWSTSLILRSTGGFLDTFDYPTRSNPVALDVREVRSHTELDLISSYSGIDHLVLTAGVKNFTDAQPPFSNAASRTTTGYAHAPFYDTRGAYFFMTANYQFDY